MVRFLYAVAGACYKVGRCADWVGARASWIGTSIVLRRQERHA